MNPSAVSAALSVHPFLEGMDPAQLAKLVPLAFEVNFEPDQLIFREGDPSSFFYLILSGKVALEIPATGRKITIQTLSDGEELGWSSLLETTNKQFQARCVEPVRALAFDGPRVIAMCEEDHEFGFMLFRKILGVVAERLRNTRFQVLDIYSKKGGQ